MFLDLSTLIRRIQYLFLPLSHNNWPLSTFHTQYNIILNNFFFSFMISYSLIQRSCYRFLIPSSVCACCYDFLFPHLEKLKVFSLIILSCPDQVIWLQLFVCSPFPSFNGSIKSTYAICMDGVCSSCLHQARLVTYCMINSTLGDFTEIHVFELWSCRYVLDWWK